MATRICPLCGEDRPDVVLEYAPREFDQCILSNRSLVKVCRICGMNYVDHGIPSEDIDAFYEQHSLYAAEAGFGTGGGTQADVERYKWYLTLLQDVGIRKDAVVADIGCGKGGFLLHLKNRGFSGLRGLEIDPRCAEIGRSKHGLEIREGKADNIPYPEGSIDALVVAQVLEHLADIHRSVQECHRVLKPGGLLLIEVPDAARYAETRLYDFAWIALMEHVNHFTPHTLGETLRQDGFSVITTRESDRSIHGNHCYPSLCVIARKETSSDVGAIRREEGAQEAIQTHIAQEAQHARSRANWIRSLHDSGGEIACWGISREFFNLIRFSGLDVSGVCALYDKNSLKFDLTVSGKPVTHPDTIPLENSELTIILTSVLHAEAMRAEVAERGFLGKTVALEQ